MNEEKVLEKPIWTLPFHLSEEGQRVTALNTAKDILRDNPSSSELLRTANEIFLFIKTGEITES